MQIVIDIPKSLYRNIRDIPYTSMFSRCDIKDIHAAIYNATVLPEGHGRLIDADYCLRKAWCNFWRHEDEMEKKDKDYLLMHRFFEQNGFEVCQQTIVEAPTVLEADKESEELNA